MGHFINLSDRFLVMETEPSAAGDPVKRMFVCDGQYVTANLAIVGETVYAPLFDRSKKSIE